MYKTCDKEAVNFYCYLFWKDENLVKDDTSVKIRADDKEISKILNTRKSQEKFLPLKYFLHVINLQH